MYWTRLDSDNMSMKKEVIKKFEFSSFEDAENTIYRFIAFYNKERVHFAIDYRRPSKVLYFCDLTFQRSHC